MKNLIGLIAGFAFLFLAVLMPWRKKPEQYTKSEADLAAAAGALVGVITLWMAAEIVVSPAFFCDSDPLICAWLSYLDSFFDLPITAGAILVLGLVMCWFGAWILWRAIKSIGSRNER